MIAAMAGRPTTSAKAGAGTITARLPVLALVALAVGCSGGRALDEGSDAAILPADAGGEDSSAAGLDAEVGRDAAAEPDAGSMREEDVVYANFDGMDLHATVCTPAGAGPFAVVVYNHGGLGEKIGGPPVETCRALASEGFLGVSPIRRPTVPVEGHIDDVLAGLDLGRNRPEAGRGAAMLGFSRGGELTFRAALDDGNLEAAVLMAPAPVNGMLDADMARADEMTAPALVMVAENDDNEVNHVALARAVTDSLEQAGKSVRLIVYPPYGDNGHELFFELGDYWPDVVAFLHEHLDRR